MNRRSWSVAGCAVAWAVTVALVSAMPGAPVPGQIHGGPPICPLTVEQGEQAAAAFATLVPTFLEPRCQNCHGGVDPFSDSGRHGGPKMKRIVTGRDMDSMDRDAAATAQTCQECHGVRGWRVAPAELSFGGKDAITLCKQVKGHFGSDAGREAAQDFMTHIGNDTFIDVALQGTRGLTEFGRAFFEADSGRPYRPEPPAASHSSVNQSAREWVDAMEGKFRGNEACGCVPERYNIIIDESLYRQVGMGPANIIYHGKTSVTIPLVFNADGTFTAEAKSTRTIRADITGPTPCVQSAELPVTWRITGRLIEGNFAANQVVQMDITFSAPAAQGTSSCGDDGPSIRPIDSRTFDNPLRRVTVPAYSVADSGTYQVGEPGSQKSNVTVYIKKEKQP